jgi:hypothetical protein
MNKATYFLTLFALMVPFQHACKSQSDVIDSEEIIGISISQKINNGYVIFILLTSDGTINRMGNGIDTTEKVLNIGQLPNNKIFKKLMTHVTEDMLLPPEQYTAPEIKGKKCILSVSFEIPGREAGFEFIYGSESMGPPPECQKLVEKALELTQSWYETQMKLKKNKD